MSANRDSADCIISGGIIHTMDSLRPRAEALAIRDGRIIYVGDASGVRALAGPHTEAIDLRGRLAFPGFIETHTHVTWTGRQFHNEKEVDCSGIRTIDEIIVALKAKATETPPSRWVVGRDYSTLLLKERRHPTRYELDQASRDHPIFLGSNTIHIATVNSAALHAAGITAATPDPSYGPSHGGIERDAKGEPTGPLWEWGAVDQVRPLVDLYSVEELCQHLRDAAKVYLVGGVTSAFEAALGFIDYMTEVEAVARLAKSGGLGVRYGAAVTYPLWKQLMADKGPGIAWGGDPDWTRLAAVKLFQDGGLMDRSSSLTYIGQTVSPKEHLIWHQEKLDEIVLDIHSNGFQCWTHANGPTAIDSILDAYERALAAKPKADHRLRIEHAQGVTEDELDRIASLGVVISFTAAQIWYHGERHRSEFFGPELASRMSPLASALRRGIKFATNLDGPYLPMKPLVSVGTAVNRLTNASHSLGPEQRIAVNQALRTFTIDAAYVVHEDKSRGSLTVGKLGDVAVLDADPYEVLPTEIKDIPVSMTVLGGKVVHGTG
jgi:predicted amidohydrolase YtcJ